MPDTDTIQLLTTGQAWHYRVLPREKDATQVTLYCAAGVAGKALAEELEIVLGKKVLLEEIEEAVLQEYLSRYYRRDMDSTRSAETTGRVDSDDFLITLITDAKKLGSSDIHIERYDERCRIRIRIDGKLVERYVLEKEEYPSLVNKIKIMSSLDIAEKRLPQDGRICFEHGSHKFDMRVSVLPVLHGEKIVMRILSNDATDIDIEKLGFTRFDLDNYLEGIKKPNGILLISGPTGSGKTTTLYATLKLLNEASRNITTIEDPIEYTLEGINQVQLKESIGLNFSSALRTFLRQDPDVIMVGEIRDPDTASMAIRASLTGHLVLSTIHTNSAWGTVSRLVDMGMPPYLIASTLNTTVAQRLVRLLCPHCKEEQDFDPALYPKKYKASEPVHRHYVARGCDDCFYTGYKGRKAIYEVVPVDEELASSIKNNQLEVNQLLKDRGLKSLSDNAFDLFKAGETTIAEIYPLLLNF